MPVDRQAHPISAIPRRIFGLLYVYYWIHRTRVRRFFERSSIVILATYLIALAVEVVLETIGREWALYPHWSVRGTFYVVVGLALWSKVREWSEHRQEFYFIQAAKKVVEAFRRDWQGLNRDEAIQGLLTIFVKNFEQKGAINANLAQPRAGDGKLVVTHIHPADAKYDGELALDPGEGGSGYCQSRGCVVYIPWIFLRHAVIQNINENRPYTLIEDLYIEDSVQNFSCILSVPVSTRGRQYGVLNFDSTKINAFRIIDFEQAMFFGFALAQLLLEFEQEPEKV
jgi:hypothetical protein